MKRIMWLIPAILLLSLTARAQEAPQFEISGGYSFLDANLNSSSFHLNGGNAALGENLNSWFGGRFEFNAYGGSVANTNISAQTFSFGPVFTYRHFDRLAPFGFFELGGMHASQGYLGISASATKLAMSFGGGVDYKLRDRIAVRVQGNYMWTDFLALRQNNIQLQAGVVFQIGKI
ncbi:MAG: porin family protein [Candidatus Acidiferrales bacterium]